MTKTDKAKTQESGSQNKETLHPINNNELLAVVFFFLKSIPQELISWAEQFSFGSKP